MRNAYVEYQKEKGFQIFKLALLLFSLSSSYGTILEEELRFCRNWHLFPHRSLNSHNRFCSGHQPRSCVFYVKCTSPYLLEGFIYDKTCKLLLFSVFPVQCYIISLLDCVH